MSELDKFGKHQQELLDSFKEKMKEIADEVLSDFYTDVAYHADADANINYKNHLRDELTKEFREEIAEKYSHYSWAHNMRMELLKHHKEQLQNKIIEDLQGRIKSLEQHIEDMTRWR